ncbi:MAG: 23S rRNA (adenine(2503)-C(2))-methyltransferase RlmN [Bacteroidaceae bacterium]|nr:23S rRNA (adenine(2503)-C(2))-methyltransferase RlmN [Bacteroidaceae bacterium]
MELPTKTPLLGKTLEELRIVAAKEGMPAFAAKQLAAWIYQKGVGSIDEMTNLSLSARLHLSEDYEVGSKPPVTRQESKDGTVKYLFPTESGQHVETVFIPDDDRGTVCVSCQVGCKMACRFCMTGRQGFQGQLTTTDILNQIYSLPERHRLTNIVFMGQGEPLDNLDAILRATQLLMADYGWAWSPKRMTVSTVGLRKGLKRFLDESPCHLAISLHNPFAEERAAIMPAERSYPIHEMLELLRQYDWTGQRRLSFEYIIFGGLNDSNRYARELVRLLSGLECRVNLIRWHSIPQDDSHQAGSTSGDSALSQPLFHEADLSRMAAFRDYLSHHDVRCTIRASRGQDIDAACGLLNTKYK